MTPAQWTFVLVVVGTTTLGTLWTYRGVAAHAQSRRDSVLAAFMASALTALFLALAASSCVNAFVMWTAS